MVWWYCDINFWAFLLLHDQNRTSHHSPLLRACTPVPYTAMPMPPRALKIRDRNVRESYIMATMRRIAVSIIFYCLHCFIAAQLNVKLPPCFEPCKRVNTGNEVIPGTQCALYHECFNGEVRARRSCSVPLVYDVLNHYCNFQNQVVCPADETCEPTNFPTETPEIMPTEAPTLAPVTNEPTASPVIGGKALECIASKRVLFQKFVLVSYTAAGVSYQSTLYTFDEFMRSLEVMGKDGFGADFQFFLFDSTADYYYGLVNTAAFLANAMVESISTDSCDENHEEGINGRYAISNSCGQFKRSYQDEKCEDNAYSCDVDPNMQVTAVTAAPGARSPPPFMCKPGSSNAGYWDTSTGMPVKAAYSNSNGRTDVEGCCFWGRGSLLTRNVCNLGKLNYYLGKGGANEKRNVLYPDIDFCANPEATCSSSVAGELRWRTGMFEWSERVQRYSSEGWDYEDQLRRLVVGDLGYASLSDFITATSRILANGCHKRGCAQPNNPNLEIRKESERIANFDMIINTILEMKSLLAPKTPKPAPPNQTPTFFSPNNPSPNNNIEQTNPGPSIEQTNPGPTIQLPPPTPPKPPAFFQPPTNPTPNTPPNVSLKPDKPSLEEDAFDDVSDLIVLEGNVAVQIGLSRIVMIMMTITTLHYMM